jgi:hypothetical protein
LPGLARLLYAAIELWLSGAVKARRAKASNVRRRRPGTSIHGERPAKGNSSLTVFRLAAALILVLGIALAAVRDDFFASFKIIKP